MTQLSVALEELGFSRQEAEVYYYLLRQGPNQVGVLAKRLGMPRTTLYTMLARLQQEGLIREATKRGIKSYSAEAPDKISHLYSQRLARLEEGRHKFATLLPQLRDAYQSVAQAPRMTVYEGRQGIQGVLNDMLLYSDLETCAVWPIKRMMAVLSPEFFRFHNKERIRRNIYTRAIWPQAEAVKVKDFPFLGWGKEFKREIRVAPAGLSFTLGYWIYANKVAFLSSVQEGYGFIMQSDELVETLKVQFEVLWRECKELQFKREDVASFVAELG